MKKIVALALCLIMALALCTTAFAVVTAPDAGHIYGYDATTDALTNDVATATYIAAKDPTATKAGNVAYYTALGTDTNFVVEDKADADFVLYTGTGYIYLTTAAAVKYDVNAGYVFAYKCPTTNTCGKVTKDVANGAYAIFTKVNGAGKTIYYLATEAANYQAGKNVLVDGTIYTIGNETTNFVKHVWTAATTNATTGAVETVACTACGAKGTVVSQAVYAAAPAAQQAGAGQYLYVLVDAAASTTTTSAVSSAKTFDAGIAMYVGMSISAVAGSAVVIGKKKEF